MPVTHYQILGILDNASQKEIKAAYKAQVLVWHPDKAKDWAAEDQLSFCEEVFKRISLAYEVLQDPVQRQQYECSRKFFSLQNEFQEKQFETKWKALKNDYAAYLEGKQNPQATIHNLKTQLANAKAENKSLADQNSSLLKQMAELEKINLELKSQLNKKTQSFDVPKPTLLFKATNTNDVPKPTPFFKVTNTNTTAYGNEKIPARGLLKIYKIFYNKGIYANSFRRLELMFDSKENAEQFKNDWKHKVNQSRENKFSFTLRLGKENMLGLNFDGDNELYNKPNRGLTVLDELENHAEISGITRVSCTEDDLKKIEISANSCHFK